MKENNSKEIILDLCGGTGSWAKPYKEAGVHLVKISKSELVSIKKRNKHIIEEVIKAL